MVFSGYDLLHALEIALRDGVSQHSEGLNALRKRPVRVAEDRLRHFRQFPAKRDSHLLSHPIGGRVGKSKEICQLGQRSFGGQVESCDDTGSREAHARGIDRTDTPRQTCLRQIGSWIRNYCKDSTHIA